MSVILKSLPIAELNPAPFNPRTISDAALAGLKASMDRFGCVELIVFNERTGHIVSGHQRYKVLQSEGVTETDVVVVDLDEAEEKVLNVAMNNPFIAGDFTPDLQALLSEIKVELPELYIDLQLDVLVITEKILDASPQMGNLEYRIIVDCDSEAHQREIYQELIDEGLKCRLLIS